MKPFNNYNEAKTQATGTAKLPAGAYICKVLGVRYEDGNGLSDRIAIQFDIAEGDYKGFFKNQYDSNTAEDKKWKGSVRIYVPTDDGSEKDSWTKKSFAGWTYNFEKSNPGYSWDWDENKWKGLLIGIVFGSTGTRFNGKDIIYTEARFPVAVETVRSGKAPEAKFKAKNGYGTQDTYTEDGFLLPAQGTDEEIPF